MANWCTHRSHTDGHLCRWFPLLCCFRIRTRVSCESISSIMATSPVSESLSNVNSLSNFLNFLNFFELWSMSNLFELHKYCLHQRSILTVALLTGLFINHVIGQALCNMWRMLNVIWMTFLITIYNFIIFCFIYVGLPVSCWVRLGPRLLDLGFLKTISVNFNTETRTQTSRTET